MVDLADLENPISHFDVMVDDTDIDDKADFYKGAYGFEIEDSSTPGDYRKITASKEENNTTKTAVIGGFWINRPASLAGNIVTYFEVVDLDEWVESAEEYGGTSIVGPSDYVGHKLGRYAIIKTPSDELVGLHEAPSNT